MEDALAHKNYDTGLEYRGVVLILVVMEDALAQKRNAFKCVFKKVLILVVMEDALALAVFDDGTVYLAVLILVVMEDALAPQNLGYALFKRIVRLDCAS